MILGNDVQNKDANNLILSIGDLYLMPLYLTMETVGMVRTSTGESRRAKM